jgi:hypothetical protein
MNRFLPARPNCGRNISIRSAEGKELLLIEDLSTLPDPQRSTVSFRQSCEAPGQRGFFR